ncbi:MAG TPA: hypothetical protein PLB62_11590 [Candidatus Sumerlaeota bacterium]|nr:hypothetical protein [Candidatus Sumerlaeota bacterium]
MTCSRRDVYKIWTRFLEWLRFEHPRATGARGLVSSLLKRSSLKEKTSIIEAEIWPEKTGDTPDALKHRHDSYRQALSGLRHTVEQYNRLGLEAHGLLSLDGCEDGHLALNAVPMKLVPGPALPPCLFPGEVVTMRLLEDEPASPREAQILLDFLCEEYQTERRKARGEKFLPVWRGERLIRRGMGHDIARLAARILRHLPAHGENRRRALFLYQLAMDTIGLSCMVRGKPPPERPSSFDDPIAIRSWLGDLHHACLTAPSLADVEDRLLTTKTALQEAGYLDESRQVESWIVYSRLSDAYHMKRMASMASVARGLEHRFTEIHREDMRYGAMALRVLFMNAHMHGRIKGMKAIYEAAYLQAECLDAGHFLLGARLEGARAHLLQRIGEIQAALELYRRNIGFRALLVDRAGLLFALHNLIALERSPEGAGEPAARALEELLEGLKRVTADGCEGESLDGSAERIQTEDLRGSLPLVGRPDVERLLRTNCYISL